MQYSFDSSALIDELKGDIYDEGNDMMVWGYWIFMPNGQKLYVDYYYVDGDAPFGLTIEQFDLKVRQEHGAFLRKKMPASELLEIFKKEDETI